MSLHHQIWAHAHTQSKNICWMNIYGAIMNIKILSLLMKICYLIESKNQWISLYALKTSRCEDRISKKWQHRRMQEQPHDLSALPPLSCSVDSEALSSEVKPVSPDSHLDQWFSTQFLMVWWLPALKIFCCYVITVILLLLRIIMQISDMRPHRLRTSVLDRPSEKFDSIIRAFANML